MKNITICILLTSLFSPLSSVWAKSDGFVSVTGFEVSGQSQSSDAQGKIETLPMAAGSYFHYTSVAATCNGDGTMLMNSYAKWAQLEGTIQTGQFNPLANFGLTTSETLIRGPVGTDIGDRFWNVGVVWTLEADDTAFEIIRGRNGPTLLFPLIYEVTARFDCNGVATGGLARVTIDEKYFQNIPIPTLSIWGLVFMVLLVSGWAYRRFKLIGSE